MLFLLVCLLIAFTGNSQPPPGYSKTRMSDGELGQFYLQKSKSEKTKAWIFLVGGAALQIAGTVSYANNFFEESTTNADVMMLVGSLASGVSIPWFISAAKNKGRAEILLRHENIPLSFSHGKQMNLGIALSIGR